MANPYSSIQNVFNGINSAVSKFTGTTPILRFPAGNLDNGIDKTICFRPYLVTKVGEAIASAASSSQGSNVFSKLSSGDFSGAFSATQSATQTATKSVLASFTPTSVSCIVLPIPSNLNDSNVISFDSGSLGRGYGAAVALGKAAVGGASAKNALETVAGFAAASGAKKAIDNIGATVLQSDGATLSTTLLGTPNPFLKLNFSGVNFKNHQFRFFLSARNQNDSIALQQIIAVFRFLSAPVGRDSAIFDVRYAWQIRFTSDEIQSYTYKFNPCYLSSVDVQYNSQGTSSFHRDGAPIDVTLTLSFIEMIIPSQETYNDLYSDQGGFLGANGVQPTADGLLRGALGGSTLSIKSFL